MKRDVESPIKINIRKSVYTTNIFGVERFVGIRQGAMNVLEKYWKMNVNGEREREREKRREKASRCFV